MKQASFSLNPALSSKKISSEINSSLHNPQKLNSSEMAANETVGINQLKIGNISSAYLSGTWSIMGSDRGNTISAHVTFVDNSYSSVGTIWNDDRYGTYNNRGLYKIDYRSLNTGIESLYVIDNVK